MFSLNHSAACWILSDGKVGLENQCLGLAEALGLNPVFKRIGLRSPWRLAFPIIPYLHPHAFRPGDSLQPPWPDIAIAGGRTGSAAMLMIDRQSGGKTFTVQIQNPHVSPKKFGAMIVGVHDGVTGKNVQVIKGALNRITATRLAEAMAQFPLLASLPRPRVAVLLGGPNRCYRFGIEEAGQLADRLKALSSQGFALMVTASRRTGAANEALIRQSLGPNDYFWDGVGANPLFAMLAMADHILVTSDSISMVSEAATTGKPVQVIHLPGGDAKFKSFHRLMEEGGYTRPFMGTIEVWNNSKLNDTEEAAILVNSLFSARLSP
jgi:mitochondrial fission protein ELM1